MTATTLALLDIEPVTGAPAHAAQIAAEDANEGEATMIKATFPINDRWRLSEDGKLQWILQRENPKAKDDRHRWSSVSFFGTLEGLLEVALPP